MTPISQKHTGVLIIRQGAMGDCLHVLPTVQQIARTHPDLPVHWVVDKGLVPLVETFPGVQQVWVNPFVKGQSAIDFWKALWTFRTALKAAGVSAVINLQPSAKWQLLTALLVGLNAQHYAVYHKERLDGVLPMQRRIMPRLHAIENFYQPAKRLLGLANATVLDKTLCPQLTCNKNEDFPLSWTGEGWGEVEPRSCTPSPCPLPQGRGFSTQQPLVTIGCIVGVGNKRANRAWPPEYWQVAIVRWLTQWPEAHVVLLGGPDEKSLADSIASDVLNTLPEATPRVVNVCGQEDLLTTAKRLAACTVVVGGDTGPLHLAAAVGADIVGLFAPTDPRRSGPVGAGRITIVQPEDDVSCFPCEMPTCSAACTVPRLGCMAHISVDTAVAAVVDAVNAIKTGASA